MIAQAHGSPDTSPATTRVLRTTSPAGLGRRGNIGLLVLIFGPRDDNPDDDRLAEYAHIYHLPPTYVSQFSNKYIS